MYRKISKYNLPKRGKPQELENGVFICTIGREEKSELDMEASSKLFGFRKWR
jgi:hypothetical protein